MDAWSFSSAGYRSQPSIHSKCVGLLHDFFNGKIYNYLTAWVGTFIAIELPTAADSDAEVIPNFYRAWVF